jgi:hypothetical protein
MNKEDMSLQAGLDVSFHAGFFTAKECVEKGLNEIKEWLDSEKRIGRFPLGIEWMSKLDSLLQVLLIVETEQWVKLKEQYGDLVDRKADGTPCLKEE